MYTSPNPIEWVKGRSRVPYFLAYTLFLFFLLWVTLTFIPAALFGPVWIQGGFLRFLLVLGIALAIVFPWAIIWALFVPMPPVGIGVSPTGLILDWGLRQSKLTWQEVRAQDGRAYRFSARWHIPLRIPVSAHQFERLTFFMRGARVSEQPPIGPPQANF
ncbi:MAG: hypothetical protein WA688_00660 [Thermoplasmata archaeon]